MRQFSLHMLSQQIISSVQEHMANTTRQFVNFL